MLSRINILKIVSEHVETFKHPEGQNIRKREVAFYFFVIPIVASSSVLYFTQITNEISNILATCMSVFTALLFNLLLLVYDIMKKEKEDKISSSQELQQVRLVLIKKKLLKDTFSNISFAIIVSIFLVVLVLTTYIKSGGKIGQYLSGFLIYYFVTIFILTLLIILKRIHILVKHDFVS